MKLIRFVSDKQIKPGIEIADSRYDLSAHFHDFDQHFFENNGIVALQKLIDEQLAALPVISNEVPLYNPIARPSKIVCVGLNYTDHAKEVGAPIPKEPVIFIKSNSAYSGPHDDIIIPKDSQKTDWECELAIVIGKKASYVNEEDIPDYIAGYILHNDISERSFMFERNGTWDKGKGCDSFAPMGPYMVTADEMPDISKLHIWVSVNGKLMQNGTTADMIFSPNYLISYITQFMTLYPGDVVSTGSPAGSGAGFKPPVFLKPGDVVEAGIDGLGTQRQMVKAYAE
ncbi:fumarylacetoacetate hydrolase family protein [Mucilaginibacter sp. KACC 22063]|uniref:fumarylacetoacetate hydrolase family protein n=1 Tax=Mucilaginibacter sp. KACC 22063 TaxID=3025666 RepID=UPI00236693D7|nr:fumarylacetoacetate hydrolase family protein [Mucilaginibacter sp. KACC 22063]WDF55359.1 fumarylacetoacetate hydrolase family protein [Mucilaginibacter sp. KACC 22063]